MSTLRTIRRRSGPRRRARGAQWDSVSTPTKSKGSEPIVVFQNSPKNQHQQEISWLSVTMPQPGWVLASVHNRRTLEMEIWAQDGTLGSAATRLKTTHRPRQLTRTSSGWSQTRLCTSVCSRSFKPVFLMWTWKTLKLKLTMIFQPDNLHQNFLRTATSKWWRRKIPQLATIWRKSTTWTLRQRRETRWSRLFKSCTGKRKDTSPKQCTWRGTLQTDIYLTSQEKTKEHQTCQL